MDTLLAVLQGVVVYAGFMAGFLTLRERARREQHRTGWNLWAPPPAATLALIALIGVPSILQQLVPRLLTTLERNEALIRQGEVWRLVTSLLVQDGGIAGTVFNLAALLVIGVVAERLWGARRLLLIFFLCGIVAQLFGFFWQPIGAGNSVADLGLAAATAVLCLTRSCRAIARIFAAVVLLSGLILLLLKDIHGGGVLIGALLGLALLRVWAPTYAPDAG